jgi:23S rRNA (cytosine1962-C5)-methyltransferase
VRPAVFPIVRLGEHELLDSGDGEKLERFGRWTLRRPDPQALWQPRRRQLWPRADLCFERDASSGGQRGRWRVRERERGATLPDELQEWPVKVLGAVALVRPTAFKHVGLFPEQAGNWSLLQRVLDGGLARSPRLLNLFGYSGVASALAHQAGAQVTHVDASKTALAWTRANLAASGLGEEAVRLILDDARVFARKAVRRAERFELILADPPHHGRGPSGETWQFEEHVAELVGFLERLLAPRGLLIFSTYAFGFSPLGLESLLAELGDVRAAELALEESASMPSGAAPRRLACGACARVFRGLEPLD